jgi:hypothetical protein
LAAARQFVRNLASKQRPELYAYWEVPMREEVLERFTSGQGKLIAAITRNNYGAQILNVDRVLFIDLDFPPGFLGGPLKRLFRWLFKRSGPSPEERREQWARTDWQRFLEGRPDWSSRVYRTAAGLRVMVTHDLFDPKAESTLELLREAGCDPLYVRLCKAQECFRARLTPKPWRCRLRPPPVRWPYENEQARRRFDEWLANYDLRRAKFATCRFLGVVGGGTVHPDVAPMIELHDRSTRADEPLKMA